MASFLKLDAERVAGAGSRSRSCCCRQPASPRLPRRPAASTRVAFGRIRDARPQPSASSRGVRRIGRAVAGTVQVPSPQPPPTPLPLQTPEPGRARPALRHRRRLPRSGRHGRHRRRLGTRRPVLGRHPAGRTRRLQLARPHPAAARAGRRAEPRRAHGRPAAVHARPGRPPISTTPAARSRATSICPTTIRTTTGAASSSRRCATTPAASTNGSSGTSRSSSPPTPPPARARIPGSAPTSSSPG